MATYEEKFDKLYQLLAETGSIFYSWKGLQKKEYEETFKDNKWFWTSVLFSLEENWLNKFANLYEDGDYSKSGEIISIPSLIRTLKSNRHNKRANTASKIIKSNQNLLRNLTILRNNQLSHNNADHLTNPQNLLKRFPVKYKEVEDLLKVSGRILTVLSPKRDYDYSFEPLNQNSEDDSQKLVEKLKYFRKLELEQYKKFELGEITSPIFPPKNNRD